jgi:hypothetical protein
VRDESQRLRLDNRHYGYRRITVLLKRTGWLVNHKRLQPPDRHHPSWD